MAMRLEELRERIARTKVDRRGYRLYSKELRRDLKAYVVERVKQGADFKESAGELGMAVPTVQNWFKNQVPGLEESEQEMGFRPVELVGEEPAADESPGERGAPAPVAGPRLVMPNGIRLEGLSLTELAALLKELGRC